MRHVFASIILAACSSGRPGSNDIRPHQSFDGGVDSTVTGDSGSGSSTDDGGSGSASDGGMAMTSLTFGVVGDTRPANEDDTANYPTAIITAIYKDLAAATPQPSFVVATGDYQYASPTGSEQQPQLDLYMAARASFPGLLWPAMGNHECTGYTDSNCGSDNSDGVTANMTVFINTLLAPINQTTPYYSENVTASDGSWTAKFVFVACNAWDTTQSAWLTAQLAQTTTYTFVMRHESAADMSEAQCPDSQTIVDANPLTLLVVGHTHEYSHVASSKEIVNGIGGAPLGSGTQYGYTIVNRNADGTLSVTTYDYSNGSTIDTFTINADGSPGS